MSDSDDFRMLDSLMREDELLFRLGVTHLFSVGYENMTGEAVERARGALATQAVITAQRDVRRTIKAIEKEALEEDENFIPVITPEFRIAILKMAAKIREVPVWTLLKYISKKGEDIIGFISHMSFTSFFFFFFNYLLFKIIIYWLLNQVYKCTNKWTSNYSNVIDDKDRNEKIGKYHQLILNGNDFDYIDMKYSMLPEYLYHYHSQENISLLVDMIKSGVFTLRLSSPFEFNDPFDSRLPIEIKREKFREYLIMDLIEKIKAEKEDFVELYTLLERDCEKFKTIDSWREFCYYYQELWSRYSNKGFMFVLFLEDEDKEYERQKKQYLEHIEELRAHLGIACLSEDKHNELLWGLYASNYKGFCLEYTHDNLHKLAKRYSFEPVYYTNERYNLLEIEIKAGVRKGINNHSVKAFKEIKYSLCRKSKAWEHEKEWRFIEIYSDINNEYERIVELPISGIYLGSEMSEDDEYRIRNALKKAKLDIPVKRIRLAEAEYKLYDTDVKPLNQLKKSGHKKLRGLKLFGKSIHR